MDKVATGVMGNNPALVDRFMDAGLHCSEHHWQLALLVTSSATRVRGVSRRPSWASLRRPFLVAEGETLRPSQILVAFTRGSTYSSQRQTSATSRVR